MISSRHELLALFIVFITLLIVNVHSEPSFPVTVVFLLVLLILMFMQYRRAMKYLEQLRKYDKVAESIQSQKKWSMVAPLVIEQQEVLGIKYNKLMRFIQQQEYRNRRNMQIISIITNSIEDPMVILNISGELEYANNRFKKWVDLSALKTVSFNEVKQPELRKVLEDALICETTRKKH